MQVVNYMSSPNTQNMLWLVCRVLLERVIHVYY